MAEEMEEAVDEEKGDFALQGMPCLFRLPTGSGQRDDDVAQVGWFVGRKDEFAGILALGEGEDVGWSVLAAKTTVQIAHRAIAGDDDANSVVTSALGGEDARDDLLKPRLVGRVAKTSCDFNVDVLSSRQSESPFGQGHTITPRRQERPFVDTISNKRGYLSHLQCSSTCTLTHIPSPGTRL